MIPLHDEITVIKNDSGAEVETIPAYVGFSKSVQNIGSGNQAFNREEAVAIVEPDTLYDESKHKIRHHDREWSPDGAPAVHYVHGEPHHVTIPLKNVQYV